MSRSLDRCWLPSSTSWPMSRRRSALSGSGPRKFAWWSRTRARCPPQVTAWATDAGVEIESVEPFLPAFDDVFVELVSKLTNGDAPDDGSAPDAELEAAR